MPDPKPERSWTEYFRILTPFLLIVITYIGSNIAKDITRLDFKIDTLDTKIFKHLTNDELHCPRSLTVMRAEYDIYQEMREKQIADIKEIIRDGFADLRSRYKK